MIVTRDRYPHFRVDLVELFSRWLTPLFDIDWVCARSSQRLSIVLLCRPGERFLVSRPGVPSWIGLQLGQAVRVMRGEVDIVQVRDAALSAVLFFAASRLGRRPFVYWMSYPMTEGYLHRALCRTAPDAPLLKLARLAYGRVAGRLLYAWVLPRAAHVFAQSERMKADLIAKGIPRERITAVPMGVSVSIYDPVTIPPTVDPRLDGRKVLVYVGSLDPERGIEMLISALAAVRTEGLHAILVLVGDTPSADVRRLKRAADTAGVAADMVFTGHLPLSEALSYVRRADVCLAPFPVWPETYLSATPTKLIEYLAMGRPVVATDHPDQRQVIEASGAGIIAAPTAGDFAAAIVGLLDEPRRSGGDGSEGPALGRAPSRLRSAQRPGGGRLRRSFGEHPMRQAAAGSTASAVRNLGVGNLEALGRIAARSLLVLVFLIAGSGFSLQLSGLDPRAPVGPDSASLQSQMAIGGAFLVMALFAMLNAQRMAALLRANLLLLALPALALTSVAWAPEQAVAARRAVAFTATVFAGFAITAALPAGAALRFLAQAAAAAVALSIGYLALQPGYGVHQVSDGVQSVHAGDWRGVFGHRTVLAQLSALSLAFAVHGGRAAFRRPWVRAGVMITSGLCLWKAHSGGGLISAGMLLALPPCLALGRRAMARMGWPFCLLLGGAVLTAIALALPLIEAALLSIVGKEPTLTGRRPLWALILPAARERLILGYGYSTGFRDVVARLVSDHSGFGYVPNAQNGYLDVVLNLGLVGLAVTLAILSLALWRAVRLAIAATPGQGGEMLPLLVAAFTAVMNLGEATFIAANDIFALIYVTALVASDEMLRRSPRTDPPRPDAPRSSPGAGKSP